MSAVRSAAQRRIVMALANGPLNKPTIAHRCGFYVESQLIALRERGVISHDTMFGPWRLTEYGQLLVRKLRIEDRQRRIAEIVEASS